MTTMSTSSGSLEVDVKTAYQKCGECLQALQGELKDELVDAVLLEVTGHLKTLRNACAKGSHVQQGILQLPNTLNILNFALFNEDINKFSTLSTFKPFRNMSWQFLANLCVQNPATQSLIWTNIGQQILTHAEQSSPFKNIQLMILYNIFQTGRISSHDKTIFNILLITLSEHTKSKESCEFLHIFLEYFLTSYSRIVFAYGPLCDQHRIISLHYMSDYIRHDSQSGPINTTLMHYLSKEFKKKSDCVLKIVESYVDTIHPREVLALIEVISLASGSEAYAEMYSNDHSLFLNIGGLLKLLTTVGEDSENIFTPMKKLEQVAPNSAIGADFEKEISFEFKTMLVRALANLSYRNRKNQEYAREMGIMLAILNCTSADGRNPLIKEWSILAIRNLCESCPENQEIIAKLSKVGDAPNEVLKELNLELGSLRIQPNE